MIFWQVREEVVKFKYILSIHYSMTSVFDVQPEALIKGTANKLKANENFIQPSWSKYVKTGIHREKAPVERDWWYIRVSAIFRKVYVNQPIGIERLSAMFGGRRDKGSAPKHPRKGSRKIIRTCLQQLENAGFIKKDKRGRTVTPQGRKFLDDVSHEVLLELIKKDEKLKKYA